jgi:hypothetical protein
VPRGDEFSINSIGIVEKSSKLDPLITSHAGIGGATMQIIVHEVVNDSAKIFLQIKRIEGNIHSRGNASGVSRIGSCAATLFMIGSSLRHCTEHGKAGFSIFNSTSLAGFLTMPHEYPNHFVTGFQ